MGDLFKAGKKRSRNGKGKTLGIHTREWVGFSYFFFILRELAKELDKKIWANQEGGKNTAGPFGKKK